MTGQAESSLTVAAEVTESALLGGRVRLRQPAKGYRAGMDAALLAVQRTKGTEDLFWDRVITKGDRKPEDFDRARELIIGSGAVAATLDTAGDYADRAKAALQVLSAGPWRAALEALADFAVSRAT